MARVIQNETGPDATGHYRAELDREVVFYSPVPASNDHQSNQQKYHELGYWWVSVSSMPGKLFVFEDKPTEGSELDLTKSINFIDNFLVDM